MRECLKQVLQLDSNGLLIFPESDNVALALTALKNQKEYLGDEKLIQRVLFVRFMKSREYITLCALYDVVIDTFPVGGGR